MRIEQTVWNPKAGRTAGDAGLGEAAQLVLVFGAPAPLESPEIFAELGARYPAAHLCFASTAGEIVGSIVQDDSVVATAIHFETSRVEARAIDLGRVAGSFEAGSELAGMLPEAGLVHVLLFSDGLRVNGTDLVHGMAARLDETVAVTGGLAGDGPRFERTLVSLDAPPSPGQVVAVGLYGDGLRVGCGSMGGWDSFGPERLITRASGNVLFELDGVSALALYKRYLGDRAAGLPASGLLFPLSLRSPASEDGVVRTILAIDEQAQSLTFAGDVPEGSYVRLMKANFDRLIDGAAGAAQASHRALGSFTPELAILISCVGRKLVLQQRVEEEVDAVRQVLGEGSAVAGFYSYGEISPHTPHASCELHNQTMTITALREA
jgi:hypothetical protein